MVSPILWYQAAQACLHFVSVKVSGQRAYPFAQLLDENLVNKQDERPGNIRGLLSKPSPSRQTDTKV